MSRYGYLELFFEGPFDFEITRVDCIFNGIPEERKCMNRKEKTSCPKMLAQLKPCTVDFC